MSLLPRPRRERSLQRPGVAVRIAELTLDALQIARKRSREQVLGECRKRAGADGIARRCRRIDERPYGPALLGLTRVVIGTVRHEDHARLRSARELGAHPRPTLARGRRVDGQVGTVLVAVRRQMVHDGAVVVSGDPLDGVGLWPAPATEAPPENDERESEAGGKTRERSRMAERIGTVEHGRRGRA